MIKLGKALYYKYNNDVLDGFIYANHISMIQKIKHADDLSEITQFLPSISSLRRSNKDLSEQFSYNYAHNAEIGALIATVYFNEQFIFNIAALSNAYDNICRNSESKTGTPFSENGRFICELKNKISI
jgi:hypothetical protein